MKISKTLSAGILASTLLLGATACTTGTDTGTDTGVEKSVQSEAEVKTEVASTVNGLLTYLSQEENFEKLAGATDGLDPEGSNDEIAKAIKEKAPEAFAYFDAHDTQTIADSYSYMAELIMGLSLDTDVERTIPEDAVTVDGDTAKVDGTKMVTVVDGETMPATDPATETDESNFINLIKVDGKWLVKAPAVDLKM